MSSATDKTYFGFPKFLGIFGLSEDAFEFSFDCLLEDSIFAVDVKSDNGFGSRAWASLDGFLKSLDSRLPISFTKRRSEG